MTVRFGSKIVWSASLALLSGCLSLKDPNDHGASDAAPDRSDTQTTPADASDVQATDAADVTAVDAADVTAVDAADVVSIDAADVVSMDAADVVSMDAVDVVSIDAVDVPVVDAPADVRADTTDAMTCAAGLTLCAGACVNLTTDLAHCGSCGHTCDDGRVCTTDSCSAGTCANANNTAACDDGDGCTTGDVCRAGACSGTPLSCDDANACTADSCLAGGGCAHTLLCQTNAGTASNTCSGGLCTPTCASGFGNCDGVGSNGCEVDTRTSAAHCGSCGHACPAGVTCAAGGCACPVGQRLVGSACVADAAPRPIAPLSLGDVTQRRPTLRWALPTGFDGAVVELCRDRACTAVIETLTVSGSSAPPTSDLPARSVVFWRIRGRVGTTTDTVYSPTWLFHVPAVSASTGVDTSNNPHFDVNGDGFDDVVIGAYQADPGGRLDAGTASVYLGSATGIAATAARVLEGTLSNDFFGCSVASAGDVNGDGFADLVVGAYRAVPGGRFSAGTASVFLGSATGIAATAARVLEGAAASDNFGYSVASAGDVNGDGYADVVVGAYGADPSGRNGAGAASVFLGSATGIPATAARVLEGVAATDNFGRAVASAGDVNGDGYTDLVVGARDASPGGRSNVGAASVFLGSATGIAATAARLLEGTAIFDEFGISVASAGDVNRDGYADLVVGAEGADPGGRNNAGTASVYFGSAGGTAATAYRVLEGAAPDDNFGFSVASAGDVNGDGYGDLVVGAAGNAGTASVFLGSVTGVPSSPARLLGSMAGDTFGGSVASGGDVNGDGYADLIVGAYTASPSGRSAVGAASVFHGSAMGIPVAAARVLEGVAANDDFGWSVASAAVPNGSARQRVNRPRTSTSLVVATTSFVNARPPVWWSRQPVL